MRLTSLQPNQSINVAWINRKDVTEKLLNFAKVGCFLHKNVAEDEAWPNHAWDSTYGFYQDFFGGGKISVAQR
jgi:hypothetical protein